jgi:type IV pilus assembly protein PilW
MRALNHIRANRLHRSSAKYTWMSAKQRGFTLVELMVSLVISLLISLAALGSARMFMGIQRQSGGAGSASGNAVTTMAAIKHEAEQASLGFYVNSKLPCQAFNVSAGSKVLATNSPLMPVNISNSIGNFAQLNVLYASALESAAPAFLAANTTSDAESASLKSYLPVQVGQTIMLTPLGDAGQPCTVRTITQVDAVLPGAGPVLHFDSSGQHNQVAFPGSSYSTDSAVSLLGTLKWSQFAVDTSGKLVMTRPIEGDSAVLARNVVGFQVQYGVTNGVSSSLQSWEYAQGTTWTMLTSALLPRVRALRLGLVIRSDQPEKPDAQGHCSATLEIPTLLDKPLVMSGNWQCFKYRSTTAIIPLRNVLMGSNS